jgi:serine/threonine-protein kinase
MSVGDDDTLASSTPTIAGGNQQISDVVAGRYRIVRWLGGGGMGRVYEALDGELGERVALKVLRAGLSEEAIERFRREVRLTRRIQHTNVARMFDIGEHAGDKFLTMELVDGEPLSRRVGRPMAWPELKVLAEQLCAGLAAAHAAGVVHRDLKPDNVLVEAATGRAVITDFGIARSIDDAGVTQVGTVVGTPRYMAPEQLAGQDVDARADLFSLGVMLFELATGERPWSGDNAISIAVQQATVAPRSLEQSAMPPAFASIVVACLALDPDHRPAGAREVGAAIAAETAAPVAPVARAATSKRPPATPEPAPPTTLAVLPIACARDDEYLADGLREDVSDTLATTAGLRVRPAAAVTGDDPREIGQRLAVDHVVVGSLRRTPAGLRVSVRLVGVADGFQIWAHKAEVTEATILTAAEQIARGIADALSTRAATAARPMDARAVDLYLRARAELRRFWGNHVRDASQLLEQAAEYAPGSPQILSALALAKVMTWVMTQQPEREPMARQAIERALATGHGEAHLASAVYWNNRGDLERGARDLGIALVRAPMAGYAHELAARLLVEVSSPVEARQHFETALGLDASRASIISADLARLDALENNWSSAVARIAVLLADPDPAVVQLGNVMKARISAWHGNYEAMLAAAAGFAPRIGQQGDRLLRFMNQLARDANPSTEAWDSVQAAFTDDDHPARQQLMGLQLLAEIALVRREPELAIEPLSIAARKGLMDIVWLDHCPLFVQLADDARFAPIRGQVAERAGRVLAAFRSVTS